MCVINAMAAKRVTTLKARAEKFDFFESSKNDTCKKNMNEIKSLEKLINYSFIRIKMGLATGQPAKIKVFCPTIGFQKKSI